MLTTLYFFRIWWKSNPATLRMLTPIIEISGHTILELHSARFMVFAGPASDRIFVLQIARFVVLTGPAADEILELHFVRLMVFAGPASDRIFVLQIARFVVLTGACRR